MQKIELSLAKNRCESLGPHGIQLPLLYGHTPLLVKSELTNLLHTTKKDKVIKGLLDEIILPLGFPLIFME